MRAYPLFVLDDVLKLILEGKRDYLCFNTHSRFAKRVKVGDHVAIQNYLGEVTTVIKVVKEKCMVRAITEGKPALKYPYI